jgi:hypothetical protein
MENSALKTFLFQLRDFVRRNADEEIAAIDRVLGIAEEYAAAPVHVSAVLPLPLLKAEPPSPKPATETESSIIDAVEKIFRADPHTAWNVRSLHRKLTADGFSFQAKNPKATIKTALTRLETKRRTIRVVQPGSGRRPTQYKIVPFAKESANGRVEMNST